MSEATLGSIAIPYTGVARAATGPAPTGPVAPDERIQLMDVLRGFALFGILQVNWLDYHKVFNFLIDGSFYTMYSFLFGLGFAIQLIRAEEKGRPFVIRYFWRTTLLFLIGAAHFVFIWNGDIVRHYGILAVVLLFVRRWRVRPLLILAVTVLALATVKRSAIPVRGQFLYRPAVEMTQAEKTAEWVSREHGAIVNATVQRGERDGDYPSLVRGRAAALANQLRQIDLWYLRSQGEILCMFILGLIIGRIGLMRDPARHAKLLAWTLVVGLIVGVAGNAFDVFEAPFGVELPGSLGGVAYSVGNIGLCLFYLSTLTLLFTYRASVRRFLAPLAPVGRMGLTNYLMQSIVLTILIDPIGFGLGERIPGRAGFLVLDAFFVVQILYSGWWFKRFRFGPVEWAWRSLTWGKLQPMRARTEPAAVAG